MIDHRQRGGSPADLRSIDTTSGGWLTALRWYLVVIATGNLVWEFAHLPRQPVSVERTS